MKVDSIIALPGPIRHIAVLTNNACIVEYVAEGSDYEESYALSYVSQCTIESLPGHEASQRLRTAMFIERTGAIALQLGGDGATECRVYDVRGNQCILRAAIPGLTLLDGSGDGPLAVEAGRPTSILMLRDGSETANVAMALSTFCANAVVLGAAGGIVFVGCREEALTPEAEWVLIAVDARQGIERWRRPIPGTPIAISASIDPSGDEGRAMLTTASKSGLGVTTLLLETRGGEVIQDYIGQSPLQADLGGGRYAVLLSALSQEADSRALYWGLLALYSDGRVAKATFLPEFRAAEELQVAGDILVANLGRPLRHKSNERLKTCIMLTSELMAGEFRSGTTAGPVGLVMNGYWKVLSLANAELCLIGFSGEEDASMKVLRVHRQYLGE